MGKKAGALKTVKKIVGTFTAKTLKGIGYTAKGIGKVSSFVSNFHEVGKYGSYLISDYLAPGLQNFAPAIGTTIGSLFTPAGGAIGGAIGTGVSKAAGYLSGWFKDEQDAQKENFDVSSNIWDTIGNGLIAVGDYFEPNKKKKNKDQQPVTEMINQQPNNQNHPAPSMQPPMYNQTYVKKSPTAYYNSSLF